MALTIGTQLGSHEIIALLGKGGMGEVYRARDTKLKREVAVKILPQEFSRDPARVSRFQREAEVVASLNHPNIAAIYDLQEANDTRFLVLELVEGETLAERVQRVCDAVAGIGFGAWSQEDVILFAISDPTSVGTYQTPSVSRDGRKLAVASRGSAGPTSWDVWVIDLATPVSSQLTFEPGINTVPIWSPDGSKIVFASDRGENKFNAPRQIYQKLSNGSGVEQLLLEPGPGDFAFPQDWSPDAQNILFFRQPTPPSTEFWLLPLSGDKKPYPYLKSTYRMAHAQFSPDGRWIAYTSEELGMPNVFVQSFPDPQGKWRVSLNGGGEPRWRRDGRELFYLALDGTLMAVPVKADPTFVNGAAIPLFPTPLTVRSGGSPAFRYDVTPDGQRFLLISPAPSSPASTTSVHTASISG